MKDRFYDVTELYQTKSTSTCIESVQDVSSSSRKPVDLFGELESLSKMSNYRPVALQLDSEIRPETTVLTSKVLKTYRLLVLLN